MIMKTKKVTTVHSICMLLLFFCTLSLNAQLVPEDAIPEKVADGYEFTEGPALGPDGCIYFTDIPAALILCFDPKTGETTTVEENSGNANGLMFDHNGDLIACRHGAREVSSWSLQRSPQRFRPAASQTYQGKKLNSPNDLDIDKSGNIYFTDPRYGERGSMEMEIEGVYFQGIDSDGTTAMKPLLCIDADLVRPNGIVLSPDESILYVSDMPENYIYAYDIESPGKVTNKRVFGRLNKGKGGGSDGMCVDQQGRLYATGHGKVWVFEPTGQLVETIAVAKPTINVTFGADNKTLYITANKGLYRITLDTDAPLKHTKEK
jgi:gluconolactonase